MNLYEKETSATGRPKVHPEREALTASVAPRSGAPEIYAQIKT